MKPATYSPHLLVHDVMVHLGRERLRPRIVGPDIIAVVEAAEAMLLTMNVLPVTEIEETQD